MFFHCVYFWLKPELTTAQLQQFLDQAHALTKIPSVRVGFLGTPASTNRPVIDRSYSYALIVAFDDDAGHDAYQVHPVHDRFRIECGTFWSKVLIYDPKNADPGPGCCDSSALAVRENISSGSKYEPTIGFSRAVKVGQSVTVSGTAPIGADGKVAGPGDAYAQTKRCIEIAAAALEKAGASLKHVVRSRVMLTNIKDWEAAAKAHGEAFGSIRPACTFVQIAGLIDPAWLVEMEFDAIITA